MIKKSFYFLFLFSSVVFFSGCKNGNEIDTGDMIVDDDYYEFQLFNLAKHEIPASIFLPDETANIGASTRPEVSHIEGDIKWEINVGPNFRLLIEDYGEISDLVEVEKKELAEQSFFKINYLIDDKDLIVYERTLVVRGNEKASPTVGVEHKSYHVYAQRNIDGINYELQSREEGYEKVIIELMAKSIKSFKPKKISS